MSEVLTLDDNTLATLARDPVVRTEFKFFQHLSKPIPKSGCCPSEKRQHDARMRMVRSAILALPENRRKRLKDLLGVRSIRVPIAASGTTQYHTI